MIDTRSSNSLRAITDNGCLVTKDASSMEAESQSPAYKNGGIGVALVITRGLSAQVSIVVLGEEIGTVIVRLGSRSVVYQTGCRYLSTEATTAWDES